MIETIPFEDERILGFRISGRVEVQDLLPVLDRINTLLAGDAPLRAYVEVADLEGVSLDAVMKDVGYAIKHFRSLTTRFERIAVVSSKTWIRRATQLESLFMPGTEERVFDEADVIAAQEWIRS